MQKIDNFVARGFVQPAVLAKASGDTKAAAATAIKSLEVGKQITGLIVAKEDSGQLQIKFADFNLNIKLPAGLYVGQRVTVQILTAGDNPTVKLLAVSSEAPPVLSEPGRNISGFLQANARAGTPIAIQGASPILADADKINNVADTAGKLEHTLTKSGVFYESHLKQWVNGTRTFADISKEPQAQHPPVNVLGSSTSETLPALVNSQLHTLDNGIVTWQGSIWPQQEMAWEVSQDSSQEESAADPSERAWSTVVRLDLPNIGPVCARISLYNGTASIQFDVDESASAALLQNETYKLGAALTEAGLTPTQIKVGKNGA